MGCGALGRYAKEVNCILSELGSLYAEQQDYERSMECFRQFLAIQEKMYGATEPCHANIMITKVNLARVCKHAGDYATAFQYYKEVHAMQVHDLKTTATSTSTIPSNKVGDENDDATELSQSGSLAIASTLSSMGLMLYLMQSFQPALKCYQEALRIRIDKLGTDHHPDVAENINSVGLVLYKLGLMDMAKEAFQECIHLRTQLKLKELAAIDSSTPATKVVPTTDGSSSATYDMVESKEIAVLLFNMATACMQNGEDDQGIKWYNESLRVERKVLGYDHPDVCVTLKHIARVHEDRGDFQLAINFLHKALEIATTSTQDRGQQSPESFQVRAKILQTIGNLHYMLAEVPQMMTCYAEAERLTTGTQAGTMLLLKTKVRNTCAETLYSLSKLHPPAPALA